MTCSSKHTIFGGVVGLFAPAVFVLALSAPALGQKCVDNDCSPPDGTFVEASYRVVLLREGWFISTKGVACGQVEDRSGEHMVV